MTHCVTQEVETLIIGAGVIGSSVAMHLAQLGKTDVRVIDCDLQGSLSSSELNAGGVRATWAQRINIEMSMQTIEYFSARATEVGYRPCGYLWLHSPESLAGALVARETQVQMGWPVEAWDLSELKRRVPFIDKTSGIAGCIFAPRDGLINPNLVKTHFRAAARSLGVVFEDRTWLRSVTYLAQSAFPIHVTAQCFESGLTDAAKMSILTGETQHQGGQTIQYRCKQIVNCAGAWAAQVAKCIGYDSPVYPMRRQVCIFDCRDVNLIPYGMIIDTSGVYFHAEASNGLAGFADPQEPRGMNYHYDDESFFMETIWPALYERSSGFEKMKQVTGWAGLYEVSPDESAVIGEVNYGGLRDQKGIYEAHSFSGHGVMHSYSAGLALAEKIVKGRYESCPRVEVLSGSRFESGKLIRENLII